MVSTNNASTSQVLMLSIADKKNDVLVSTRSKDYRNPSSSNNQATNQPSASTMTLPKVVPPIIPKLTIKLPKGVVHKSTFNPHARAAQNCNIVEDLAQSPSAMSTRGIVKFSLPKAGFVINDRWDRSSNLVVFNHIGYTP